MTFNCFVNIYVNYCKATKVVHGNWWILLKISYDSCNIWLSSRSSGSSDGFKLGFFCFHSDNTDSHCLKVKSVLIHSKVLEVTLGLIKCWRVSRMTKRRNKLVKSSTLDGELSALWLPNEIAVTIKHFLSRVLSITRLLLLTIIADKFNRILSWLL